MAEKGDAYLCQAITRACDVLEAFKTPAEEVTLSDLARRAGLSVSTAYRILFTLEQRGLVRRAANRRYRINIRRQQRARHRIGFTSLSQAFAFPRAVTAGLAQAATAADVELVVLDNRFNPRTAVANARRLIREKVDLAIVFQAFEQVAPEVSERLKTAGIPMIAVDIPHPGATYFGADNFKAGAIGGRFLGQWARTHWKGRVDEVLMIGTAPSGSVPMRRMSGIVHGIHTRLAGFDESSVVWLEAGSTPESTMQAVRKHLRQSRAQRVLVGAIHDPFAIATLRAFEDAGRDEDCAIVSHNASLEGRQELRRDGSRLLASVAYFPERYGEPLLSLAIDVLAGKEVPAAVFVRHQLVTPANVDNLYPNDQLLPAAEFGVVGAR